MTQDPQAPATKQDITLLMETLGTMQQSIFNTEEGLHDLRIEFKKDMQDSEHRTHVLLEDLRHDMIGTHKDKIQDHDDRIVTLERKTGLATAA